MGIISYAQNFEDVLLARVFAGLNYGFYVDIGAYHPVEDSVTKAFYDRGWSGINIEPGEIFSELSAARSRDINLNMAVYDRNGEIRFAQHPGWYAGLSHVEDVSSEEPTSSSDQLGVETRTVPCDTLTNILERHGGRRAIAFIKIDAEGAELAIIRSTNWRVIRPTVLLIEATLPLSTELDNQDWEPLLLEQGYLRAYFDGINCFYVPEERSDLLRLFAVPVNVLDGFLRPESLVTTTLRDELKFAQEQLAKSSDELKFAQEQLAKSSDELNHLQLENTTLRNQDSLLLKTISIHDKILNELRQQFDERVQTVKAEHQRREAELQAAEDRRVALMQEDSEERIRAVNAKYAELERSLAEMGQQQIVLTTSAMRLHRLIFELRWPDGPRALRAVLPLARMIRRLKGARPLHLLPALPGTAVGTEESGLSHLGGLAPAAQPRRSLFKRLAWLTYRSLRPVARPLAWRLRGFMIGETNDRLTVLDQRVASLATASLQDHPIVVTPEILPTSVVQMPDDGAAAEIRRLAVEMERTLLTLALERVPMSRLVAPPDEADNSAVGSQQTRATLLLPHGRVTEIACMLGDLSVSAALAASGGEWEPHVRRYLESVVQSDWVCLDIGAKLGAHTLSLATLAEDGKVFAFESDTANFALLSVNSVGLAAPHATIFPLNLALWVPRETSIYGGADKLGGRSLLSTDLDAEMVEHHLRTVVDSGVIDEVNHNVRRRPIAGLRLDEWAAEHGLPRVDLVKLDVEGAEVQVIRGAAATLRRHRPILLVKYNPSYAAGFGEAPEALYEELAMRFVAIYALEQDGSLTPVTDWITLQTRHARRNAWEDLVCLPEML